MNKLLGEYQYKREVYEFVNFNTDQQKSYLYFFSRAAGGGGAKGHDGCRGQQHLPGVSATLQTRCCYLVQAGWREQSGAQPGKHTSEDLSIEANLRNGTLLNQYPFGLQVVTGEQLVVIERGILIRQAELSHGGVYHCQVEEHGYHWTAVTVRLTVWSPLADRLLASWSGSLYRSSGTQRWYEDVMALIHPGNIGQHCQALGYRPPRNQRRHGAISMGLYKEKGERHKHGGGRARGGGGGGRGRAVGRKSRSKPQQRAPRSA